MTAPAPTAPSRHAAQAVLQPRLRVVLETPTAEHPAATTEYIVQTDNRDQCAWDVERDRRRWPAWNEAMFLFWTYLSWAALTRSGEPVPATFSEFQKVCPTVHPVDLEDVATSAADGSQLAAPFPMAHGLDSWSPLPLTPESPTPPGQPSPELSLPPR